MMTRIAAGLLALASILPAAPPPTVTAEKGTLRVSIDLTGTFRPADPARIDLNCEAFRGPFKLETIAANGAWVNKGDIVARLDTKAYAEALVDETMAMDRAEMEMRLYLAKLVLDKERETEGLERAARELARAVKKLKGFREYEKGFDEEQERLNEQAREHGMERSKDELTQLEKMYTEDELVDATEEIVLKRQRRGYARALANDDLWKRRTAYGKEWYDAWREEDHVAGAEAKEAALRHAKANAEMGQERTEADLKKRKHDLEKKREVFEQLKADGQKLVVRAPQAGLFLHGDSGRGVELEKGAPLRNEAVFARIMQAGALELVGEIKETDILRVNTGLAAEVKPHAAKDQKLMGSLQVGYLPTKTGSFEAIIALTEPPPGLRPGMGAAVELILSEVRDAVLVPKSAVQQINGKSTVRLLTNGDVEEREVVTGASNETQIVIREGVSAGDQLVVEAAQK